MTRTTLTRTNLYTFAFAAALLSLPACTSDAPNSQSAPSLTRNSIYDPMQDAAPGDNRPSAPSISNISPDQVMGNSTDDIMPGSNTGAVAVHR